MHVLLAAEEATATGMPPVVVGLLAFGALMVLLGVAYAFRNVGNRN